MEGIVSIETNLMSLSVIDVNIDSKGARLPRIPCAGHAIRGFEALVIRARFVGYVCGEAQLHIVRQIG